MKIVLNKGYCMNLDIRNDRWTQCQLDFKILKDILPFTLVRFPAILNKSNPSKAICQNVFNIIDIAKEENLSYVLILEDDFYIIDPLKIKKSLESAPDDWDILSAGSYHYIPDKKYNDNWMKMKDFCSLHFIIIRNNIYDKVQELTKQESHLDRLLAKEVKNNKINMYLMHPMPCQQRSGYSNLRKKEVNDNKRNLPWIQNNLTLK